MNVGDKVFTVAWNSVGYVVEENSISEVCVFSSSFTRADGETEYNTTTTYKIGDGYRAKDALTTTREEAQKLATEQNLKLLQELEQHLDAQMKLHEQLLNLIQETNPV